MVKVVLSGGDFGGEVDEASEELVQAVKNGEDVKLVRGNYGYRLTTLETEVEGEPAFIATYAGVLS